MCFGCDNPATHDFSSSMKRSCDSTHRAEVSPSAERVPPSVQIAQPWKSLPFARVVIRLELMLATHQKLAITLFLVFAHGWLLRKTTHTSSNLWHGSNWWIYVKILLGYILLSVLVTTSSLFCFGWSKAYEVQGKVIDAAFWPSSSCSTALCPTAIDLWMMLDKWSPSMSIQIKMVGSRKSIEHDPP